MRSGARHCQQINLSFVLPVLWLLPLPTQKLPTVPPTPSPIPYIPPSPSPTDPLTALADGGLAVGSGVWSPTVLEAALVSASMSCDTCQTPGASAGIWVLL